MCVVLSLHSSGQGWTSIGYCPHKPSKNRSLRGRSSMQITIRWHLRSQRSMNKKVGWKTWGFRLCLSSQNSFLQTQLQRNTPYGGKCWKPLKDLKLEIVDDFLWLSPKPIFRINMDKLYIYTYQYDVSIKTSWLSWNWFHICGYLFRVVARLTLRHACHMHMLGPLGFSPVQANGIET